MRSLVIALLSICVCTCNAAAQTVTIEHESRTLGDKYNAWFHQGRLEVFTLRTPSSFELEAGPSLTIGPLQVTPRAGIVWSLTTDHVLPYTALILFTHQQWFTALSVNEISHEEPVKPSIAYQEGYAAVHCIGSNLPLYTGIGYEHSGHWTFGPRVSYDHQEGIFRSIALWAGLGTHRVFMTSVRLQF